MAWATREEARRFWKDAEPLDDATLDVLLDVATQQCQSFAPLAADPVPSRYMLATVYQARELYAASQRGEGDVIGFGDYAIRARPLTSTVKALLRPQRGVPVVG